ncbi:MAG: septum formation family protein [Acidimicrobiales bacterium]
MLLIATLVAVVILSIGDVAETADANVSAKAEVGTCFGESSSKAPVSCSGSHSFEVFMAVEYGDLAEHPGDASFWRTNEACDAEFSGYVGKTYLLSRYDYIEVFTDESEWAAGNRRSVCALYFDDGTSTTWPARDSGR